MEVKEVLKESSIGMALVDAIPVIFFLVAMILVADIFNSVLFLIGVICCTIAGTGKVIWKLIMAITKKNIVILNRQFKILMPGGFLIILFSVIVNHKKINWFTVWKYVSQFPGNILFGLGLLFLLGMIIGGLLLDFSTKKANWIEQIINVFAQLFIFLGVLLVWYASDYYKSESEAVMYLVSTDTVTVSEIEKGLFFDGPGTDTALIFYPGAKVEYDAYAPLMHKLAENGVDCFLIEMPYNLAFFGINYANSITKDYSYDTYYIGGHSLGGVAAISYANKHTDKISGIVLLASYPTDTIKGDDTRVISIYGSNDKVVKMDRILETNKYVTGDYELFCIDGGNHAGFAMYGKQAGDGDATISNEEQIEDTVNAIAKFIFELKAE